MSRYYKINRFLLAFYAMCFCYFMAMQEYQTALAMALLWLLSRGCLAIEVVSEAPLVALHRDVQTPRGGPRRRRVSFTLLPFEVSGKWDFSKP